MDSSLTSTLLGNNSASSISYCYNAKQYADYSAIQSLSKNDSTDSVNCNFSNLSKSLTIEASEILAAINKHLEKYLPNGVESVNPEDATPEATADRIVSSIVGLFSNYQKAHSNVEDEKMLENFMKAVRSGVTTGYEDAYDILDGLGAFQFDGVESGIKKTLELVHQTLDAFEESMREQLGLVTKEESSTAESVKNEILSQAGKEISVH